MGISARHHLKGYTRELRPRIALESMDWFPTKMIDFSRNTADKSFTKESKSKAENSVGQNQRLSTYVNSSLEGI